MMKKHLPGIISVLILGITLAGCGVSNPSLSVSATNSAISAQSTRTLPAAFSAANWGKKPLSESRILDLVNITCRGFFEIQCQLCRNAHDKDNKKITKASYEAKERQLILDKIVLVARCIADLQAGIKKDESSLAVQVNNAIEGYDDYRLRDVKRFVTPTEDERAHLISSRLYDSLEAISKIVSPNTFAAEKERLVRVGQELDRMQEASF